MKNKTFNSTSKMKGWTERRLFDGKRFALVKQAIILGLEDKDIDQLTNWASKPMFRNNFLWNLVHKYFGLDLQVPVLFGNWTTSPVINNTITSVGKRIAADQVGGTTTTPVTAIAIGVGTPSATALGSESTTNGGSRGAATVSNQTSSTTGDTERWVKTFTFTGSLALTEEGLFDNNTSGGKMLASQAFSAVSVVDTDTFQITHNVNFA